MDATITVNSITNKLTVDLTIKLDVMYAMNMGIKVDYVSKISNTRI